jgi:hypothetical protein
MGLDNRHSSSMNLFRKPKKSEILPQNIEKTIVVAELNAISKPISNKPAPLAIAIRTITTFMEPIAILIGINEKYHEESPKTERFRCIRKIHAQNSFYLVLKEPLIYLSFFAAVVVYL